MSNHDFQVLALNLTRLKILMLVLCRSLKSRVPVLMLSSPLWCSKIRDIFDVKDAPRTCRPFVENVDKITEIFEVDRYVSSRSIAQELKTDHKTDLYCQQLDCLKLAIDQKWPELVNRRGVVFHQDNARPHTSVVTRQNLWELGWEVLTCPAYSPDLAPSD
ncbi:uncharacterized protein TNCV_146211 [Trichonephila clavipes]|nr:uncharacterized protein TNCV_146211 [Trichonephila clavipes]